MTEVTVRMEEKYGFLKQINAEDIVRECDVPWLNQTLCSVNDCVIRLGVAKGEIAWHKHDKEDEFFMVLSGTLFLDIQDGPTFELGPKQGCTVPRGVVHRTRSPDQSVYVMVEGAGVSPTGD